MKNVGDGSKKQNERVLEMVDIWLDSCGASGRICKDCGDKKECGWSADRIIDRFMN